MDLFDGSGDEEEDLFTPKAKTHTNGLGALFSPQKESTPNELKYQAPKGPGQTPQEPLNGSLQSNRKSFNFVVDAFRFDSKVGQYVSMGRLGLSLVDVKKEAILVLYRSQNEKLSITPIQEHFQFRVQVNQYCSYSDSRQIQWSLHFQNQEDLEQLSKRVAFVKARHGEFKFPVVQELEIGEKMESKINFESLLTISYVVYSLNIEDGQFGDTLEHKEDLCIDMESNDIVSELWRESLKNLSHVGTLLIISSYNKVKISSETNQIVASVIQLHEVRERVKVEPAKPSISSKVKMTEKMARLGQAVMPMAMEPPNQLPSTCQANPQPEINNLTQETIGSIIEGKTLSDLILAENRLQATEIRMSLMRMDDKLEKLLIREGVSGPSGTKNMEQTKALDEKHQECLVLEDRVKELEELLKSSESEKESMQAQIEQLNAEISMLQPPQILQLQTPSEESIPVKKLGKLLSKAHKSIQNDFPVDQTFLGLQIHSKVGDLFRGLLDHLKNTAKVD